MTRPYRPHPIGWQVATLEPVPDGGVVVVAASGSTPDTSAAECWGGSTPWLTPKEITDQSTYRYVEATERTITVAGLSQAGRLWEPSTVMLTKRAPVGVPAINLVAMATNQGFLNFKCGPALLPEYLYYWFLGNLPYLEAVANGSTYPELYVSDLFEFEISVPSITEQRTITHILGTLDDKIELNRRMSETLEAIARALFKSWFVDFEPVCAKVEGHDPGLPKPLANLFPDTFEASEMGKIPKGWSVRALPNVIDVNPKRVLRKGGAAPYLDMANMPTRGHTPDDVVERAFGSGMRFINGDTLIARITPCLENGKTAFVDFLEEGQVGWGSTEYIVLHPKSLLPEEFAYCLARSNEFREFAVRVMTGSSGRQRVPPESLSHYLLAVPPEELAIQFGSLVKPMFARAAIAARESRILATQRDILLPKFISGNLCIRNMKRVQA